MHDYGGFKNEEDIRDKIRDIEERYSKADGIIVLFFGCATYLHGGPALIGTDQKRCKIRQIFINNDTYDDVYLGKPKILFMVLNNCCQKKNQDGLTPASSGPVSVQRGTRALAQGSDIFTYYAVLPDSK